VNDTDREFNREYRRRLMALEPEERFIRGALMFDAAREMVLASLADEHDKEDVRPALYRRIYGEGLPEGVSLTKHEKPSRGKVCE
jgi:hypothetical protein